MEPDQLRRGTVRARGWSQSKSATGCGTFADFDVAFAKFPIRKRYTHRTALHAPKSLSAGPARFIAIFLFSVTFRIIWRSLSAVFGVTVTLTDPDTGREPAYYANRITDLAKATVEACSMCVEESAEILFDYAKYR